jgi:hypothetical protein
MGDFPMALREQNYKVHTRLIKDCHIAEDAPFNPLHHRWTTLMGFTAPADSDKPVTFYVEKGQDTVSLELEEQEGQYKQLFCHDSMTSIARVPHQS